MDAPLTDCEMAQIVGNIVRGHPFQSACNMRIMAGSWEKHYEQEWQRFLKQQSEAMG